MVGLQTHEAALERRRDVIGGKVVPALRRAQQMQRPFERPQQACERLRVVANPQADIADRRVRVSGLGRDQDSIAAILERAAQKALGDTEAVVIRDVEEIDSAVHRLLDSAHSFPVIAMEQAAAERLAAETEFGHLKVRRSELPQAHAASVSAVSLSLRRRSLA